MHSLLHYFHKNNCSELFFSRGGSARLVVSSGEVNNDGAGWGWTGMEIAQAAPTPGLPAATGDSTTHWMKQSVGNPSCLLILSLKVTSGEQGTEEQDKWCGLGCGAPTWRDHHPCPGPETTARICPSTTGGKHLATTASSQSSIPKWKQPMYPIKKC